MALRLHVDVRERFLRAVAQGDETVIGEDEPEEDYADSDEDIGHRYIITQNILI